MCCFIVRATSWNSGVLFICHNVMYICCRSYRGRLFYYLVCWKIFAGSGCVVCCVYCRSMLYRSVFVLRGDQGGGGGSFLCFSVSRVTSLCGVTWLISSGFLGCPVSSVRVLLFG